MASSTPATSFSSDDSDNRGRPSKRKANKAYTRYTLLSPRQSDAGSDVDRDAHDTSENTDATVVERAFQAIWDSFCGCPANSNLTFPLRDQQSYDELYQKLEEHPVPGLLAHFQEAVRRDWVAGVLTLRLMVPSPLHDQFQEEVKLAIWKELDRIASERPDLRPFRDKIRPVGQAQVQKRQPSRSGRAQAPTFEVSPDGQYRYQGSRTPPFILEVAYSQDADNLRQKITQIFMELEGRVSAVLAFDIDYKEKAQRKQGPSHAASVSLWTSERDHDTINVATDSRVFRADDGRSVPGELALPSKSFLPLAEQAKLPQHDGDEKVRLDFALLAELLHAAEQTQRVQEASVSPSPPLAAESRRPAKRIKFVDLNTDTTRELQLPASKRQRSSSGSARPVSARTRSSASQPRRSGRLRSLSQDRTPQ
ncbi:hypothetical protein DHEL01_v205137 [Diaporthe helianthi]|uniref:Uncharacterized protein n=1 Tax=Diaporthe helianthi TaxID=158607 RepID=A0A2P5I1T9_DIAHE|nr:hypothetical protein DHEL01_v205137 [Diaporthe helianthi]